MTWPILSLAFVLGSVAAFANEQPPLQNYQLVSGDCNVLINNPQGGPVEMPNATICSSPSSSKSSAESLRKLERFFEASNPTEVQVSHVSMMQWLGDSENYLTLSLDNTSNLPAEKVKVRILDAVKANEKVSRTLPLSPSRAIPQKLLDTLTVPRHGSIQIPIGPESELVILTKRRVTTGYDFLGVSLSPNVPDSIRAEYLSRKGIAHNYQLAIESAGLGVELKYDNIFGGSSTVLTGLYLFYGRVIAH